jgi:hypothetical protein
MGFMVSRSVVDSTGAETVYRMTFGTFQTLQAPLGLSTAEKTTYWNRMFTENGSVMQGGVVPDPPAPLPVDHWTPFWQETGRRLTSIVAGGASGVAGGFIAGAFVAGAAGAGAPAVIMFSAITGGLTGAFYGAYASGTVADSDIALSGLAGGLLSASPAAPSVRTAAIELALVLANLGKWLTLPANSLTQAEVAEIQSIATKYGTTIDIVGSRAAGEGRNINTDFPAGKGRLTRSDIDFRIDTNHPRVNELIDDLRNVGGGAGSASIRHGTNHRPTVKPFIRFIPR